MGMFDYFRSSYDLGEPFTNVVCQTKDIEEGIGGTMTDYWLDPAGWLWCPDYKGTTLYEEIPKDDPRYHPKMLFLNYEWVPTGAHGKYRVCPITKYIMIYPENWREKWEHWPTLRLHFKQGRLIDYEDTTSKA